ncbi:hypothetical protein [Actinomadura vinacea]
MSIIQPVHCRYGYLSADTGQDITVVDPSVGGEGLKIYFSQDVEDPHRHHADAGGPSLINGPNAAQGFDVWGDVSVWLADLWAPAPVSRTEFQMWVSLCEVLADGSSGATVKRFPAVEAYAPLNHDDKVWNANGDLVRDGPGHRRCNMHFGFRVQPLHVAANRRLRVHIAQMHDNPLVPGHGKPWPGYVRRADADLLAVPR